MKGIVQTVLAHAERQPDRIVAHVYSRREAASHITWAELGTDAGRAAGALKERGVGPDDVVVLIGTHQRDLYAAWLGCVWLGAVPSILAEPTVRVAPEVYWARLGALFDRIRPRLVACDPRLLDRLSHAAQAPLVGYDVLRACGAAQPPLRDPDEHDLLLLQHSSGTTGLHKGVMLSHGAVGKHADAYARAIALKSDDVVASWLPLYHDMGLIACFINPLLWGSTVVWMSPFEWVANPRMLVDAVSEHRATLAWLPNFAFAFVASRVRDLPPGTDLASLRAVVNCSEPITAAAMDAFVHRFGPVGFSGTALQASYAMAENVFAVTSTRPGAAPKHLRIDQRRWQEAHVAVETSTGPGVNLVSSGQAVDGCRVRIVDDTGRALPQGHAGRVMIHSPFLFDGYYLRNDLNGSLFDADGFFDTGDLGLLDADGEVYITGRRKDLVIVGGRNVYPQDVEDAIATIEGVYPGRAVCFGVPLRDLATEGLVALAESTLEETAWPELAQRIRRAVPERLDLDLIDVRVVARNSLRKSSSGKLARAGNREWYLEGRFGELLPSVSRAEE